MTRLILPRRFAVATLLSVTTDAFSGLGVNQNRVSQKSALFAVDNNVLVGEEEGDSRRAFITTVTSTVMGVSLSPLFLGQKPAFAADVDYEAVASDIESLIKSAPDKGPTLVRLAWHSSGTYDKMSKTGGSSLGTMRFKEEFSHGANAGLKDTALTWMEPLISKYEGLSYADLYTLAGGKLYKNVADC